MIMGCDVPIIGLIGIIVRWGNIVELEVPNLNGLWLRRVVRYCGGETYKCWCDTKWV